MTDLEGERTKRTAAVISAARMGLVAKALTLFIAVAAQPLIVRHLGIERYGAYVTVTALASFMTFADLGIGNGLISELTRHRARKDLAAMQSLVSSAQLFLTAIGVVVATLGALSYFAPWELLLHSDIPANELRLAGATFLVVFGLGVPLSLSQKLLLTELRGDLAATWAAAQGILSAVAAVLAALAGANLPVMVAVTVGSFTLVGGIQTVWLLRTRAEYVPSISRVESQVVRRLLRKGAVFLILGIGGALAYQLDLAIVSSQIDTASAGRLAVAIRVLTVVQQLTNTSLTQLWSAFSHAIEHGDHAWVRQVLWRSTAVIAVITGAVLVPLVLIAPWGIKLLFGQDAVADNLTIALVGLWVWYQCVNTPIAYLLNGAEAFKFLATVVPFMAVSDLVASLYLVHPLGTAGPVAANLITHTALNLIPSLIWLWHRFYRKTNT
jgi:O-antigen/teichoic acid export membrane protein